MFAEKEETWFAALNTYSEHFSFSEMITDISFGFKILVSNLIIISYAGEQGVAVLAFTFCQVIGDWIVSLFSSDARVIRLASDVFRGYYGTELYRVHLGISQRFFNIIT